MGKDINDYSCYFGLECMVTTVISSVHYGIVKPHGNDKISIEGKESTIIFPLEYIESIVNLKS